VSKGLKVGFLALVLAAGVGACDSGRKAQEGPTAASGEQGTSSPETPTIESSFEGLAVLPPRIAWSVETSLPPGEVKAVHFFVDGDRWWDDSVPPYTFGPQGAYFPASWLSSVSSKRTHEFMVRVKAKSGDEWQSEAVHIRTPEANLVQPPGGFGRWGTQQYARLSRADLAHPPSAGELGTGWLVFIGSSLFVRGGKRDYAWEGGFAWEISGDRERLHLGTPIFLARASHADAGTGFDGVDDVLCAPDGPPATYRWSQTRGAFIFNYGQGKARFLELRAVKEPCEDRRRLLEGVWEGILAD
jgi:hypothetical protein